jgi:hypothetical protein
MKWNLMNEGPSQPCEMPLQSIGLNQQLTCEEEHYSERLQQDTCGQMPRLYCFLNSRTSHNQKTILKIISGAWIHFPSLPCHPYFHLYSRHSFNVLEYYWVSCFSSYDSKLKNKTKWKLVIFSMSDMAYLILWEYNIDYYLLLIRV